MKNQLRVIACVTLFASILLSSCNIGGNSKNNKYSAIASSYDPRWPLFKIEGATNHVVFKEEGKYASFPSLAIDPSNDYLYTRFSVKDAPSHTGGEKGERQVSMESRDGGITWKTIEAIPPTVYDSRPGLLTIGNDGLSGGAFELPSGDALIRIGQNWRRWFPIERLPEFEGKYDIQRGAENRGPGPDFFAFNSGGYVERSEDSGKTWQRTEIPELDTYVSCSSPWSYDQLPDGTVIRVFAVRRSANDPYLNKVVAVLTRDGRTAQVVDVMGDEPGYWFTEETLVHVTSKGIIWMLTRVHDMDKNRGSNNNNLWQAVSVDGGRRWTSMPTLINIGRSPASGLVQLDDGRLVLVAGYRGGLKCGIHVLVSEDEGLTWCHDRRIALRQDGHGFDLGYPRAVKLRDGTVVTIYYYSTAEEVASEGPATRSIVATRFRVPQFND
jgi:hypothetical protein